MAPLPDDVVRDLFGSIGGAKGDTGINPTTNLPWGVYPDKGSPTGYTLTSTGQPVYEDGSLYTGATKSQVSGGGSGGAVSQAGRYVTNTDTSGAITGIPGAVYQQDTADGSITIVSKPSAAASGADPDGDGYDNKTGLPVGVVTIGGKFYYQGKQVNPDGSLYDDSGDKPNASTWTGYGPKGQGTYYLDGPNGTPGTFIGATTAAGAGSSNISVSGIKSSTYSGGSGSSSYNAGSERDYAAEDAANDARAFENSKALMLLADQLKNDPNNPYLIMQQQQLQLQQQQLAQTASDRAADRRVQNIKDFESAVSSTDMARLNARRLALSPSGDVSIADLLRNTPEGFQANDAAAALLAEIRGVGGQNVGGIAGQFGITTPMAPVTGGSSPAGGGAIPPSGSTGPVSGSTTSAPPASPMAPVSGPTNPDGTPNMAWQIENQRSIDEQAKQQAYNVRSGWFPSNEPGGIVYRLYENGQPVTGTDPRTGKPLGVMSAAEYSAMYNQQNPQELGNPSVEEQLQNVAQEAMGIAQARTNLTDQGFVSPFNPNNMPTFSGGGGKISWDPQFGYGLRPGTTNTTAQTGAGLHPSQMAALARDISTPQGMLPGTAYDGPSTGGNVPGSMTGPAAVPTSTAAWSETFPNGVPANSGVPLLRDNGGTGLPTGTAIYNPDDYTLNGVRRYAKSGMAPVGQPAIVGERGPEMMLPTPQGTIVRPMHPVQAQSMLNRGTPGYALGTSPTRTGTSVWDTTSTRTDPTPFVSAPAPIAPTRTYTAPVAPTQPIAPMQPVATQPAPVTQPVQQPVTQPVAQPQPVATAPAAPAPTPMQPVTTGGTTVPTSPVYNPAQPTAVTPQSQYYLDEIKKFRDAQNALSMNPQDVSFGRLDPLLQQAYFEQEQTRTGVPVSSQQFERNRYAMAGRGRAMQPLGM